MKVVNVMSKKKKDEEKAIISYLTPIQEVDVEKKNVSGNVVNIPKEEEKKEDIVVYNNGITTVDFM